MQSPTSIQKYLLWYGLSLLFSLLAISSSFVLRTFMSPLNQYLFFLPAVIASAWYGGKKAGLFSLLLTCLGSFFLFSGEVFPNFAPAFLLNLFFFIATGTFIVEFIDQKLHSNEITSLKRELTKTHTLLENAKLELDLAKDEIKARDEFLSIASHELKTPLTTVLLQIQAAVHNIKNVSLANFSVAFLLKMLESVETQTERLSKMINDLLNISLITTGKMDLEKEKVNLADTVKEVADRFHEKLQKDGIELTFEAEKKEIIGNLDRLRLEQVVNNLLTNAIKYGNNKPIQIKVSNSQGTGKIIIRDHGLGIPSELQQKVFEKFERAGAKNSPHIKGLGVGLYITKQIVEAHKGRIKVDSTQGQGSTFTVEFPLSENKN